MTTGDFIDFEWYPDPLVIAKDLDIFADEISDFYEPLELSVEVIINAMRRNIDSEGEGSWPYWSETYAPKAIAYPNIGILRKTDENIYDPLTDVDNFDVTDNAVAFTGAGMPNEMWVWHEEGIPDRQGGKGGKPNPLPARPFIGLDASGENEIVGIFATWLDELLVSWGYTQMATGQFKSPTGQFQPKNPYRG